MKITEARIRNLTYMWENNNRRSYIIEECAKNGGLAIRVYLQLKKLFPVMADDFLVGIQNHCNKF